MRTVFLDTVGLLALWDETDQWHSAAASAFNQLAGDAAARRPYRSAVARLRERMEAAGHVIWPSAEEWDAAWSAYARGETALAFRPLCGWQRT